MATRRTVAVPAWAAAMVTHPTRPCPNSGAWSDSRCKTSRRTKAPMSSVPLTTSRALWAPMAAVRWLARHVGCDCPPVDLCADHCCRPSPCLCVALPHAGKSNIMDAISFVLGLQARALRCHHMRDLIFRAKGEPATSACERHPRVPAWPRRPGGRHVCWRQCDVHARHLAVRAVHLPREPPGAVAG